MLIAAALMISALLITAFAEGWCCPNSGQENTTNFCPNSGTQKPAETQEQEKRIAGTLMKFKDYSDDSGTTLWGKTSVRREQITSARFYDTLDGEEENSWDASAEGDGSVKAWIVETDNKRELVFGANGSISLDSDCGWMFSDFENAESIGFSGCVLTSDVRDMSYMFI